MGRKIKINAVGIEKDFPGWWVYQLKINQLDFGGLYLNKKNYTFAWNSIPLASKEMNYICLSLFAFLGLKFRIPKKSGTISIIYDRLFMGEVREEEMEKGLDEIKDRNKLFIGDLEDERNYAVWQSFLAHTGAILFLRYDMSSAPYCSFTVETGKPNGNTYSTELTINMPRKQGVSEDLLGLILETHARADYISDYADVGKEMIYKLNRLVKES